MSDIDKNQAGLTLGTLFALCHGLWIVLVAAGVGDTVLELLHTAHFVSSAYNVTGVGAMTALGGVIGAFVSGYVIGWVTALVWNRVGAYLD